MSGHMMADGWVGDGHWLSPMDDLLKHGFADRGLMLRTYQLAERVMAYIVMAYIVMAYVGRELMLLMYRLCRNSR